ncbi:MAG: 3-oxoacyl-ACP reductase FabG [Desulfobacterales bacterium]|jgi:NAD(P)-dependent dehydrogenase (short-subunit alcohol dehydrogenase family)|nr:3-oxoacyl-ACP reductase [Desulfobacter sp.]MDP6683932.1 3-oxoacyl-ACP reductase FabG [Desulfobacterales bacterium]MDP6808655.1 3-oxoacyl-ACP reductase FabG [Desulfobacterales bacterium]|tara:strand:+ start:10507 stop:11247 length:741 start_codon:yes stop_codon:yes gene_type:complete
MKLKDKVALVTGAGGDLGRGMALEFAKEGAKVVVNDINGEKAGETVQMITSKGDIATGDSSDLTDSKAVLKMVDKVIKENGDLHILVNSAGDIRDAQLVKMSDEEWDFVLDLNLKASFVCARAVAPHMIKKRYGKILNLSSMAYKGNIGQVNYTSAKAGVVGLTQALGLELARYNINVNCIAPGLINTPKSATLDERVRNYLIKKIPMQCMGEITDIAKTALFLVSDDAQFITRQIIHVSGGMEGF